MSATTNRSAAEVGRTRWVRLIPIAIIVYIISFMDRTNIGFALDGLHDDLGIDATQQGLAAGVFFIGYLTLQIPGGHLAEHWSARKFVGIMILVWGVLAVAGGFVQTFEQLLVVRFFLGVAEAGIWPAILVLISHWFPAAERARAYGFWMMNIAISSIITAPLSGWILSFADWRALFIIEGAFPFVIAAPLWWMLVADHPREAKWCSVEEREYIEAGLAADRAADEQIEHQGLRDVVRNTVVLRLTLVYFLIQIGFYGLNTWLPHVVTTITGGAVWQVGLVTAIPYVVAMAGLWFNAKAADRTGRYSRHVFLSMLVGAVTLVASVALGTATPFLAIALISVGDRRCAGLRRSVLGDRLARRPGGDRRRRDGLRQRDRQPRRLRRTVRRRLPAGRQRRQLQDHVGVPRAQPARGRARDAHPAQARRPARRRDRRGTGQGQGRCPRRAPLTDIIRERNPVTQTADPQHQPRPPRRGARRGPRGRPARRGQGRRGGPRRAARLAGPAADGAVGGALRGGRRRRGGVRRAHLADGARGRQAARRGRGRGRSRGGDPALLRAAGARPRRRDLPRARDARC